MKISDILSSKKLSLSFEVFPPKTDANFESVKIATEEIAKLKPSFMSVLTALAVGLANIR